MKAAVLKSFRDKHTGAVYAPGEVLTLERERFAEIREKLGNAYIAEIVDPDTEPEEPEGDLPTAEEPGEPEEPDNGAFGGGIAASTLAGLSIGSLALIPAFAPGITHYTARTANNTNKVRAVAADDTAVILVAINGEVVPNDASVAWSDGENTLTVSVAADGGEHTDYTVIVTKE